VNAADLQQHVTAEDWKVIETFLGEAAHLLSEHPPPQEFLFIMELYAGAGVFRPVTSVGASNKIEGDHRLKDIVVQLRKFERDKGMQFLDVVDILEAVEQMHPGMKLPKSAQRMRNAWKGHGFIPEPKLVMWWINGIQLHGGDDLYKNREKFEQLCAAEGAEHVHGWLCTGLKLRYDSVNDLVKRLTGQFGPLLVPIDPQ